MSLINKFIDDNIVDNPNRKRYMSNQRDLIELDTDDLNLIEKIATLWYKNLPIEIAGVECRVTGVFPSHPKRGSLLVTIYLMKTQQIWRN